MLVVHPNVTVGKADDLSLSFLRCHRWTLSGTLDKILQKPIPIMKDLVEDLID